jgi:hypothetical protein
LIIWILNVGADYPLIRATPIKLIQKNFTEWQKLTGNPSINAANTEKFLEK